jgi:hypothetical protein
VSLAPSDPDAARREWPGLVRLILALLIWHFLLAAVIVASLYGALLLLASLIYHSYDTSRTEFLFCWIYAPITGALAYCLGFAFFRRPPFYRRGLLSAATGTLVSWIAMLAFYKFA